MKITKIFFALVALLVVACKPNPNSGSGSTDKIKWLNEGKICGEWVMTKHADKETEIQVYIAFNEDSSFDLYQRVYSVVWLHYKGTFTLEGTTLSGVYSDGKAWGSRYTVSYAEAPNRIRLTSLDNKSEVAIYTEQAIPEYILDESQQPEDVRSVEIERFL
uniref:hypothetical protein n=1 Tax=Alistipes sp. TaxID=1872444 RepID=UPI00405755F4